MLSTDFVHFIYTYNQRIIAVFVRHTIKKPRWILNRRTKWKKKKRRQKKSAIHQTIVFDWPDLRIYSVSMLVRYMSIYHHRFDINTYMWFIVCVCVHIRARSSHSLRVRMLSADFFFHSNFSICCVVVFVVFSRAAYKVRVDRSMRTAWGKHCVCRRIASAICRTSEEKFAIYQLQ